MGTIATEDRIVFDKVDFCFKARRIYVGASTPMRFRVLREDMRSPVAFWNIGSRMHVSLLNKILMEQVAALLSLR